MASQEDEIPPSIQADGDKNGSGKGLHSKLTDKVVAKVAKYQWWDWETSNLRKLITGAELEVKDVDNMINTLSIVDALLLTIPFATMGMLNYSYWDWLDSLQAKTCGDSFRWHHADSHVHYFNTRVITQIWSIIICAIGGIILAVVYYTLRPSKDEIFRKWYWRGRILIAFMFALCAGAVLSVLSHAGNLLNGWFVMSSDMMCTQIDRSPFAHQHIDTGFAVIAFLFATAVGLAV